jgi:hypothetical protein
MLLDRSGPHLSFICGVAVRRARRLVIVHPLNLTSFLVLRLRWQHQMLRSNSKLPVLQVFSSLSHIDTFLSQSLGAINRHRSGQGQARAPHSTTRTTYVNPSYKPPSSKPFVQPEHQAANVTSTTSSSPSTTASTVRPPSGPGPSHSQPHDVTINGVVFERSKRSLVRKDSASIPSFAQPFAQHHPSHTLRQTPLIWCPSPCAIAVQPEQIRSRPENSSIQAQGSLTQPP